MYLMGPPPPNQLYTYLWHHVKDILWFQQWNQVDSGKARTGNILLASHNCYIWTTLPFQTWSLNTKIKQPFEELEATETLLQIMLGQHNNRTVDFSATSAESASAGSGFSSKMSWGGSDLASSAVYKEKQTKTQWGLLCLQYWKPKVYKDCGWGCACLGCGVDHADHKGKMTWAKKNQRNEKPTTMAWNKLNILKSLTKSQYY